MAIRDGLEFRESAQAPGQASQADRFFETGPPKFSELSKILANVARLAKLTSVGIQPIFRN